MRINYTQANIASLAIYLLALSIGNIPGADIVLSIVGVFSLFVATPMAFFQIFRLPSFSIIEKYFAYLVFYFFLYAPLFFFLNQLVGIKISIENILIINLAIFACALIATKLKCGDEIVIHRNQILDKKNSVLFGALIAFLLLHVINYHFYGFMPEWDGYTDLIKLEKGLADQNIAQGYRGFFYSSVGIFATFTGIQLYTIFTFIFIALHTSILLVLSRLIHHFEIKKKSTEAIIYLLALSVPVINMEIDMTRPQNSVIIFLPILIYFIYRFFTEKKRVFIILSAIIALGGINYHEFFIFPLLTYSGWIALVFLRRAFSPNESREQRIIAALVVLCFGLAGILITREIGILQGVIATMRNIIIHIADISAWRLWFIGSYSSSGADLEMGWPGITGAGKYYGYYLSPALFLVMIAFAVGLVKKLTFTKNSLAQIILPFFLVLFAFAEILPRLNHLYLPERFWLLIDTLLILVSVPLLKYITEIHSKHLRWILLSFITICIVGLSGSFYIAKNKKALTSNMEYQATVWIQENTSKDSSFITQAANFPMIAFFAERKIIQIKSEYFLSKELLEQNPKLEIDKLNQDIEVQIAEINSLVKQYTENKISFPEFADKIQEQKSILRKIEKEINSLKILVNQPKYILYSFNKFDTIYKDRAWWMTANAYGANLEKFNKAYSLVYDKGGVYIWKVR